MQGMWLHLIRWRLNRMRLPDRHQVMLLSRQARADLEDIRRYTIKTWGRAQWLRYYRGLVNAFERIDAHPEQGQDRRLLVNGMRSVPYQRHLVFYRQMPNTDVVILRIVHQQRNLPALMYYDDLDAAS